MEAIIGTGTVVVIISIYLFSKKNKYSDDSTIRYQISRD